MDDGGGTRTSSDHQEGLSANEEALLGNRARLGVGGSERGSRRPWEF